jgi:hypothetical protein
MSHFFTMVILPKGAEPLEEKVAELLAPFDESLEMQPYEVDCYCLKDGKPDESCSKCHGKGVRMTTCSPNAKWDWWVVGGRWSGTIQNEPTHSDDGGFNFGKDFHQLSNNTARAEQLLSLEEDMPLSFAVVTPDGHWHERGEMGWFGMTRAEKPQEKWKAIVVDILKQYKDSVVVGVDCHI